MKCRFVRRICIFLIQRNEINIIFAPQKQLKYSSFARHGNYKVNFALLVWLNANVRGVAQSG